MTALTSPRRPEHMHNRKCAANAMTNVLENWRDDDSVTDHEFILALQDNLWFTAREYLQEGGVSCVCNEDGNHPCLHSCCDYGRVDGVQWQEQCDHGFSVHSRCPMGCEGEREGLEPLTEEGCGMVKGCRDRLPHEHPEMDHYVR